MKKPTKDLDGKPNKCKVGKRWLIKTNYSAIAAQKEVSSIKLRNFAATRKASVYKRLLVINYEMVLQMCHSVSD